MSNRLIDNEEVEVNVGGGGGDHHQYQTSRGDDNDVGILTLSDSVTNSSLNGGGETPIGVGGELIIGTGDLGDGGLEGVSSVTSRSRFNGPSV